MKSFDDILKDGRGKFGAQGLSLEDKWAQGINLFMSSIDALNDLYEVNEHFIDIIPVRCADCTKVSYSILLQDIIDTNKSVRYHRGGWKAIDADTYFCEACK